MTLEEAEKLTGAKVSIRKEDDWRGWNVDYLFEWPDGDKCAYRQIVLEAGNVDLSAVAAQMLEWKSKNAIRTQKADSDQTC